MTVENADDEWQWWYSLDGGERYYGPHESRDQAIAEARGADTFAESAWICEATKGSYNYACISAYQIIENMEMRNEELIGEDGVDIHPTAAQEKELEELLGAAIQGWWEKHNFRGPWSFSDTRNEERVTFSDAAAAE